MTTRTTNTTVTFAKPFLLGGFDELLAPGTYDVETDEELLEGLSFPAYRRVATLIHLPAKAGHWGPSRTLRIDPDELASALQRDRAAAPAHRDEAERQALERAEDEGMIARAG